MEKMKMSFIDSDLRFKIVNDLDSVKPIISLAGNLIIRWSTEITITVCQLLINFLDNLIHNFLLNTCPNVKSKIGL